MDPPQGVPRVRRAHRGAGFASLSPPWNAASGLRWRARLRWPLGVPGHLARRGARAPWLAVASVSGCRGRPPRAVERRRVSRHGRRRMRAWRGCRRVAPVHTIRRRDRAPRLHRDHRDTRCRRWVFRIRHSGRGAAGGNHDHAAGRRAYRSFLAYGIRRIGPLRSLGGDGDGTDRRRDWDRGSWSTAHCLGQRVVSCGGRGSGCSERPRRTSGSS